MSLASWPKENSGPSEHYGSPLQMSSNAEGADGGNLNQHLGAGGRGRLLGFQRHSTSSSVVLIESLSASTAGIAVYERGSVYTIDTIR
jgi:hypothetical protein